MSGQLTSTWIFFFLFAVVKIVQAQEPAPEMIFVKGGEFKMGSVVGGADEQPVHVVALDDFYIGKFEVSQLEWKTIMAADTNKRFFEGCDSCPVERVSWYNVQEFIDSLNARTGMNYRLPTEAEWEYAARGGALTKGYKYSGSNSDVSVGWKVGNSGAMTHPSGHKKPNELGIYDMTGNVFEWCSDWYSAQWYQVSPEINPTGPSEGSFRVIRGGSWFYDHSGLRNTDRESANPSYRYGYVGFRLCLASTPSGSLHPVRVPPPRQGPPTPSGSKKTQPDNPPFQRIVARFIDLTKAL